MTPEPKIEAKPAETACDVHPASWECKCEQGDTESCLKIADEKFRSRSYDAAIIRTYALCQEGVADACFRAAHYMKTLGIQKRLGITPAGLREKGVAINKDRCAEDDALACYRYGRLLFTGKYVTANAAMGIQKLEASCARGHGPACSFLASAYELGTGGLKKDKKRALQLLESACTAGEAASCAVFGDRIFPTDKGRARELYEKACNGDDGTGCGRVGQLLEKAGKYEEAHSKFLKACGLEDAASCVNAGALAEAGRGTNQDPAKARELYKRACDAEVGAGCVSLASLVAKGLGGRRNWGEAVELAEKACSLEFKRGCRQAARLRRNPPDWRCTTEADCESLCGERIGKACTALGDLLATKAATEVLEQYDWGKPDCSDAKEAYGRACTYGDGLACLRVGKYEHACKLGEPDACILHDYTRYEGASAQEEARIVRSLKRRCSKGSSLACIQHSELVKDERLLGRACKKGSGEACRVLAYHNGLHLYSSAVCCTSQAELDEQDERYAEEEKWAQKGRDLLRKACDFGDLDACAWGFTDYAGEWWTPQMTQKMKARARELLKTRSCGRGARSISDTPLY